MVSCLYNRNTRLWCVNDGSSTYSFTSEAKANEFCVKIRMAHKGMWFSHKENARDSVLGISGLVFSTKENTFVFVPMDITPLVYELSYTYGSISAAYNALIEKEKEQSA